MPAVDAEGALIAMGQERYKKKLSIHKLCDNRCNSINAMLSEEDPAMRKVLTETRNKHLVAYRTLLQVIGRKEKNKHFFRIARSLS